MLATEGFTGSDLAVACREAAMAPVRELLASEGLHSPANPLTLGQAVFRPLICADFMEAVMKTRPSCTAL